MESRRSQKIPPMIMAYPSIISRGIRTTSCCTKELVDRIVLRGDRERKLENLWRCIGSPRTENEVRLGR